MNFGNVSLPTYKVMLNGDFDTLLVSSILKILDVVSCSILKKIITQYVGNWICSHLQVIGWECIYSARTDRRSCSRSLNDICDLCIHLEFGFVSR